MVTYEQAKKYWDQRRESRSRLASILDGDPFVTDELRRVVKRMKRRESAFRARLGGAQDPYSQRYPEVANRSRLEELAQIQAGIRIGA